MYNKDYYLAHREEILARAKKWREEHPEQYRKALKRCVNTRYSRSYIAVQTG